MELQFEYVNIPRNNYFEYLVEEKLNPLARKFPIVISANVFFKVENKTNEIDSICEIKLDTQKSSIYVVAHEESIEQAIQKTYSALEKKLIDDNN
ncbi:HPF/RaiA family ribosome-associated protein [Formosa sp. 3Alg 14/1]|uniref:HPF/RaiA family ribosome-associated protein n=1 Tax=Formosa sp. 3Alg 14/1 TaxID=3382190 RepID=UPI0039BE264A